MIASQTRTRTASAKGDDQDKEQSNPSARLSLLPPLQSSSIWLRWKRHMSAKIVSHRVQHIMESSAILSPETGTGSLVKTRVISRHDFKLGKLVGEGSCTRVYEIISSNDPSSIEKNDQVESTYVIKQLRPEVIDLRVTSMKEFQEASTNLIREVLFLARLNHPNILQIHGISSAIHNNMFHDLQDEGPPREGDYFFVMPRIRERLDERIQHWKEKENADKKAMFPVQCPSYTTSASFTEI
jgi:hypothetical protein